MVTREELDNMNEKLRRLENLPETLTNLLDKVPYTDGGKPKKLKEWILQKIFTVAEIREICERVKKRRPPRLVLIGPSGVGKSSLINAMLGRYVADISHVDVGTKVSTIYKYELHGKSVFEVLDTKGISEYVQSGEHSSEAQLREDLLNFRPDAVLLLKRCKERAHFDKDIDLLKKMQKDVPFNVPVIVILSQCDEIEDSSQKHPMHYSAAKLQRIEKEVEKMTQVLRDKDVKVEAIIPVSSYVKWQDEERNFIESVDEVDFQKVDRDTLSIAVDGRHNISELIQLIEKKICFEAALTMSLNSDLQQCQKLLCNMLVTRFSLASTSVTALSPPFGDLPVITTLQIVMVLLIGYISGRELTVKTALEFMASLGTVTGMAFLFRSVAGGLVKILLPGAGQGISASVAYAGTLAIGKAAEAYYISNMPHAQVMEIFQKVFKKNSDKEYS